MQIGKNNIVGDRNKIIETNSSNKIITKSLIFLAFLFIILVFLFVKGYLSFSQFSELLNQIVKQ